MRQRLRQSVPAFLGLILFLAALEVLRVELRAVSWHTLNADIWSTPPSRLALAVILTALNYLVLTTYDFLALAYIGKRMPAQRVLVTSFLAYAIANNVGFSMLSGTSVRYRFYSRWGLTAEDLSRVVLSVVVTFWLGLLLVGGFSLLVTPLPAEFRRPFGTFAIPCGILLMLASAAYVFAAFAYRAPIRLRSL